MKTIAQSWQTFEAQVLPKSAGAVQRQEMRRAFYAGFHGCLTCMVQMADESGKNDDIGVTMVQRLHDECARFAVDLQAGRA